MVKSPWRLLTGLLSRGKPTDQHEVERPGDGSSASETSRGSEPALSSETSSAPQAGKDDAGDRQEPTPPMAVEVPDAVPADEATASAPGRDVVIVSDQRRKQRRGKAPLTTRRKSKADVLVHTKDVEPADAFPEQVAANEPDPVRTLESEIQELRSQLAGKLRIQNDQLRRMLKRFEPK